MNNALFNLVQHLGVRLTLKGHIMAVAESCTGGLLAATLTDVPGSSSWFDSGFVTYSNKAKIDLLGVLPSTLDHSGAVSADTAMQMVSGALMQSSAHYAIAVTGIAGPGGGSDDKPVGTVFIAWQWRGQAPVIVRKQFAGNRQQVRLQTVQAALQGVFNDQIATTNLMD